MFLDLVEDPHIHFEQLLYSVETSVFDSSQKRKLADLLVDDKTFNSFRSSMSEDTSTDVRVCKPRIGLKICELISISTFKIYNDYSLQVVLSVAMYPCYLRDRKLLTEL